MHNTRITIIREHDSNPEKIVTVRVVTRFDAHNHATTTRTEGYNLAPGVAEAFYIHDTQSLEIIEEA